MTAEDGTKKSGEPTDQMFGDIVRGAEEYYSQLKRWHARETRVYVAAIGLSVWFAAFVVLGVGAYVTIKGPTVDAYLFGAFLAAIVAGIAGGLVMYLIRRRRGFKFGELGDLLSKIKEGKTSSEEGLHLVDLVHRATLVARQKKLDTALGYGLGAFILVSVIALNAGFGGLAGIIVYLYFRFEAMREYEREDQRYETSKKELLLSL